MQYANEMVLYYTDKSTKTKKFGISERASYFINLLLLSKNYESDDLVRLYSLSQDYDKCIAYLILKDEQANDVKLEKMIKRVSKNAKKLELHNILDLSYLKSKNIEDFVLTIVKSRKNISDVSFNIRED